MSEIFSNKDINDIMLIDLANKELRQDIKLCLMLISSKKQHSFDFKKYEERKKHLHEIIDTNQEHLEKTKLVSLVK